MSRTPTPHDEAFTAISDRTKLTVSVGIAIAICASIIGSTWTARGYLETLKTDIANHFATVELSQSRISNDLQATRDALTYKWSEGQMSRWATQLERLNREVERGNQPAGLIVPDPTTITQRGP